MRRLSLPAAVLVVLLTAAAGLASVRTAMATLPSIYVDYGDDCTFTMRTDGGISLGAPSASGTTIPPGPYQVVLDAPQNAPACPLDFQLTGPGVRLEWEFGGEALDATATETFLPSSTYVASDLRDATRGRAVFTTAATGSSASLATQPPSPSGGNGQTIPDVVGSAVATRGTLRATLSPSGALSISSRGRRVSTLEAGRYTLVVTDRSRKSGLTVRRAGRRARALTGTRFTGARSVTLELGAGTWLFTGTGPAARVTVF